MGSMRRCRVAGPGPSLLLTLAALLLALVAGGSAIRPLPHRRPPPSAADRQGQGAVKTRTTWMDDAELLSSLQQHLYYIGATPTPTATATATTSGGNGKTPVATTPPVAFSSAPGSPRNVSGTYKGRWRCNVQA